MPAPATEIICVTADAARPRHGGGLAVERADHGPRPCDGGSGAAGAHDPGELREPA